MDLRQLEILQAIAETGSFTASGRKLNVSQSARRSSGSRCFSASAGRCG
jgi:DNA-binding transcriptional LysR family regulator